MPTKKTESLTKREIMLELTKRHGVLLFNNMVGKGYVGGEPIRLSDGSFAVRNPRKITFGLPPGSSDIIGCRTIIVTEDMVGKTVAIFAAIEVKKLTGKASTLQENFIERIISAGGIAGIARSVDDAENLLKI